MDSKSELRRKKLQWQAEAEKWRVIADELASALKWVHRMYVVGGTGEVSEVAMDALAKYNKMREVEDDNE